ncbi:hypothetical protein HYPBUDRAFT_156064 [Hyphopichia burtonii NRRL Y-1933]|uniref:Uncharacterized protein n=1 Tax=Hyphopichia burtonii NRRL Y-1933 TaxID=984485 RepID=A0A1E4RP93_9ASCO|nr:hypothetical protein HYPBUDRAFT_156064 [Hyphopichia burtonii NRRL Y-1933]ODV69067.1 hypothetical protein HYPBUDRAFT_156064 [Hyphopichia burtonii NRRL Y-1933]
MNSNNVSSKYNLPRFRRINSQHTAEQSYLNANDSINTTLNRTVSSSSSIMSTPSNNIRKVQQHQQPQQQETNSKKPISSRPMNNLNVKKKLLNLQQSLKRKYPLSSPTSENTTRLQPAAGPTTNKSPKYNSKENDSGNHYIKNLSPMKSNKNFILRKPMNMNRYDYSIFINNDYNNYYFDSSNDVNLSHEVHIPPIIKESQIKAWESAEKITNNLIFDSSSDDDDDNDDDNEEIDNIDFDTSMEEIKQTVHDDLNLNSNNTLCIQSIPGLTKGELQVVKTHFNHLQKMTNLDINSLEEDELKLLWKYRETHQLNQEKAFASYQSLLGKRKVQISQKKDILHKIFGYNNNINHEYITNNTSYSALENILNTQKAFHEDKEEINSLLYEDKFYSQSLLETKNNLNLLKNNSEGINIKRKQNKRTTASTDIDMNDFDYDKFNSITSNRLSQIYQDFFSNQPSAINPDDSADLSDVSQELQSFTVAYLKRCIKDDADGLGDISELPQDV